MTVQVLLGCNNYGRVVDEWNNLTTGLGSFMKQSSEAGATLDVAWSVIVMCAGNVD